MYKYTSSITVGIPYYSETTLDEIKAAIDSIYSQTLIPNEIHLIQDGMIYDEVASLIKEYKTHDSRIKHFIISERKGLPNALNVSIKNAESIYYARMDSDDISHPERLEKQIKYLEEKPSIDMVGTWAIEFNDNINSSDNKIRSVPTRQEDIYRVFHYRNPLNHPTIVFRMTIFDKIGLYNPAFLKAQDTELYARAFKNNIGVANIPEVLYYLRMPDIVSKRATFAQVKYQLIGRYKYNTWSPVLNLLKIMSIIFRLMPKSVQRWGYSFFYE